MFNSMPRPKVGLLLTSLLCTVLLLCLGQACNRPEEEESTTVCYNELSCEVCEGPITCDYADDCYFVIPVCESKSSSRVDEVGCGYFKMSTVADGRETTSILYMGYPGTEGSPEDIHGRVVYWQETQEHEDGCSDSQTRGVEPECDEWRPLPCGDLGAGGEGGAGGAGGAGGF